MACLILAEKEVKFTERTILTASHRQTAERLTKEDVARGNSRDLSGCGLGYPSNSPSALLRLWVIFSAIKFLPEHYTDDGVITTDSKHLLVLPYWSRLSCLHRPSRVRRTQASRMPRALGVVLLFGVDDST